MPYVKILTVDLELEFAFAEDVASGITQHLTTLASIAQDLGSTQDVEAWVSPQINVVQALKSVEGKLLQSLSELLTQIEDHSPAMQSISIVEIIVDHIVSSINNAHAPTGRFQRLFSKRTSFPQALRLALIERALSSISQTLFSAKSSTTSMVGTALPPMVLVTASSLQNVSPKSISSVRLSLQVGRR